MGNYPEDFEMIPTSPQRSRSKFESHPPRRAVKFPIHRWCTEYEVDYSLSTLVVGYMPT